jgi:hypothetical protein
LFGEYFCIICFFFCSFDLYPIVMTIECRLDKNLCYQSECRCAIQHSTAALNIRPCLVSKVCHQILLCKNKILIISKCRHIYGVLNVDEIKS